MNFQDRPCNFPETTKTFPDDWSEKWSLRNIDFQLSNYDLVWILCAVFISESGAVFRHAVRPIFGGPSKNFNPVLVAHGLTFLAEQLKPMFDHSGRLTPHGVEFVKAQAENPQDGEISTEETKC